MTLIPKNLNELKIHVKDPLYQNSFYLLANNILGSVVAFFFWIVAARFYSTDDIGIASALISSSSFILIVSRLGFDFSIIRFFPIKNKSDIFNTSIFITTIFSFLLGILFILGIDFFSPDLSLLKNFEYSLIFLFYLFVISITTYTSQAFLAMRQGKRYFFQNLVMNFRLLLIFLFVFLGALGIFLSFALSALLALVVALILLKPAIKVQFSVNKEFIQESFLFSTGNYTASLFSSLPVLVLPILILNLLGPEKAGYYYIGFMIASIIFMIPNAISTSLFVEGSHGESLKKCVIKAYTLIIILLTSAIIGVFLLGDYLLLFFGSGYAESVELLKIFSLSSFFVATSYIYYSIKRVEMKVKNVFVVSCIVSVFILLLSLILIRSYGILGVSYAWLVIYGLSTVVLLVLIVKKFSHS